MERFTPSYEDIEGTVPVTEFGRAELKAGIATAELVDLSGEAADLIATDDVLRRLLSHKINSGPELDPAIQAHLSRLIAARSGGIFDQIADAESEREFWALVGDDVRVEIGKFRDFEADVSDTPDLWDIALEDLGDL